MNIMREFSRNILITIVLLAMVVLGSCKDNGDNQEQNGWAGIEINQVNAPDQYTVSVVLSGNPGKDYALNLGSYIINSDYGSLPITGIDYDQGKKRVKLTTIKQKLGIVYTLVVENGASADFWSADTAKFWTYDFSSTYFSQYQVNAYRAAVGTFGVIYIEEDMTAYDLAKTINDFDLKIYPIETSLFIQPPDIDGNGKILILGLDGDGYFGGYFSATNTLTEEEALENYGIHSNETEMVYINVVDGSLDPVNVVSHEFGHLLHEEGHSNINEYWPYHDEGLAECAVHAVYNQNHYAIQYYLWDPYGILGNGLSLVHWNWGLYDNYVQAYLFWTYIASRINGVQSYRDLFYLETGNPGEVNTFLQNRLSSSFTNVHFQNLIANWIQAPTGIYGYNSMLSFPSQSTPTVPTGTTSVNLEPFTGTYFNLNQEQVSYPGTQGPHIIYAGLDPSGNVDLSSPFTVNGGALLAYNSNFNYNDWTPEHSGPDIPSGGQTMVSFSVPISPAWLDPPPIHPGRMELVYNWRHSIINQLDERREFFHLY